MKRVQLFILTLGIAFVSLTAKGQGVPLGQWKDYLSYRQGVTVAQGNGKIFCVAGSGVFSYSTIDNSLQRYNKVTGLSDVGPTVARFSNAANTLVIGYSDGNIDLVQGGRITNLPDLKNAPVQGSKIINNIYFIGTQAYISCAQGIIQVDLTQDIIMYTYVIGPGGSALNVYGVSACNDTLFAATAGGAYKIALSDPNFSNFNDWKLIKASTIPYPTPGTPVAFDCIATVGDSLYLCYSSYYSTLANTTPLYGKDTVYVYFNGKWTHANFTGPAAYVNGTDFIHSIQSSTVKNVNYLVLTTSFHAQAYLLGYSTINLGNYNFSSSTGSRSALDALLDGNMNIWVADSYYGLVKTETTYYTSQAYDPPGPFSNEVASINVAGDGTIWITPGGYTSAYSPDYNNSPVSTFQDGTWSLIPPPTGVNMNDVNCLAMDPNNPKHVFAGSFDNGIWEYTNTSITSFDTADIAPVDCGGCTIRRIAGIGYDTLGNLWSTSCIAASNYLAVRKTDGTWKQFNFSSFLNQGTQVVQLLVTRSGAKWAIMPSQGILAFQDNGTFSQPSTSNTEIINSGTHHGALPSLNLYCMAEDLNGAIWVGTDQKVVVFYSPDNVYDGNGDWDAANVYVNQNGYTQYLMQNQTTNCIAVDGANRKWIGTQGGGAFLMSADGTQQVLNFTAANSPLLSNNVQEIAINPKTGEVFFGTDQGVVSYRGTATEGNSQFTNVYAYPNPVPHGYDGPVAITGLVTNSDVKITTINGEIVYHTTALGGQAIWYGTNFDGKRVQTGVYLVFCASPDGTQTHIAKLLFIN